MGCIHASPGSGRGRRPARPAAASPVRSRTCCLQELGTLGRASAGGGAAAAEPTRQVAAGGGGGRGADRARGVAMAAAEPASSAQPAPQGQGQGQRPPAQPPQAQPPQQPPPPPQFGVGGGGSSRHEKSLGLLTTKFVSLLQEAKDGVLDLKAVSARGDHGGGLEKPTGRRVGRAAWLPGSWGHVAGARALDGGLGEGRGTGWPRQAA